MVTMLFKKKTKSKATAQLDSSDSLSSHDLEMGNVENRAPSTRSGFFAKLKTGLFKTRQQFSGKLEALFRGKKVIDAELMEGIETILLSADVGVASTQHILETLTQRIERDALKDPEVLYASLKSILLDMLKPVAQALTVPDSNKPYVILMVGINGSGKTTSIGKLACLLKNQYQKKVLLAAGDTFRAAAIEQLQLWGERNTLPVIAQSIGADSASVIFDALQAAIARKYDVLIADTAGRLHTQTPLMDELKKIKRVMSKLSSTAPDEVLLVLDASIGQNALIQAEQFLAAVQVTGIIVTKLDGTAKAGVIFNIAKTLNIPIRYIGIGEKIEDLKVFDPEAFVEALFSGQSGVVTEPGINS